MAKKRNNLPQTHYGRNHLMVLATLPKMLSIGSVFDGVFTREVARNIAPFLFYIDWTHWTGCLPSVSQAARYLGDRHGVTTRRYLRLLEKLQLARGVRSKRDKRVVIIVPEDALDDLVRAEQIRIGDVVREAVRALNALGPLPPVEGTWVTEQHWKMARYQLARGGMPDWLNPDMPAQQRAIREREAIEEDTSLVLETVELFPDWLTPRLRLARNYKALGMETEVKKCLVGVARNAAEYKLLQKGLTALVAQDVETFHKAMSRFDRLRPGR